MLGRYAMRNVISFLFAFVPLTAIMSSADAFAVSINEVMALNDTTIPDQDGDFSDWIELVNVDSTSVNLVGCGLTDTPSDPFKWVFPNVLMEPGAFLLVFASGKDRTNWPGELHTNFAISAGGEPLLLTSPDGAYHDSMEAVHMAADVSYGRVPDGGDDWWFLGSATPGSSNGNRPPPGRAASPEFSPASGSYPEGVTLTISSADEGATIRYTLDGSIPTDSSTLYAVPVVLDTTTVVRAASFVDDMMPSMPASGTFLIAFETTLPVASVITDPPNLWDEETGIYVEGPNAEDWPPHYGANYWQKWEIPVVFEFFEPDGTKSVSQKAGARIFGGWSRCLPQKSLRLTARNQYGPDRFSYPFFPDQAVNTFKSLILRNAGDDWDSTMMRDALMTGLMEGSSVAIQAYRPMVVFLNGAYWGIHNLRERLDEYYLASHYGVDTDSVDIIEMGYYTYFPTEGDSLAYAALLAYLETHDVADPAVYDSVQSQMDVENFIRYNAAEIYYANTDWPGINNRCWREQCPEGRFQWLLYDTDCGFGSGWWGSWYDHNTVEFATVEQSDYWANDSYATFLLRRLLDSDEFRETFIIRFCDLMNTSFESDRVVARINSLHDGIEDEMSRHIARWYPEHDWEQEVDVLREFALLRKGYVLEYLRDTFNLEEPIRLTVNRSDESGGRVRVNAFLLETDPWEGDYFGGMPISLAAEPFTGYRFAGWSGDIESDAESIVFIPESDTAVLALFEPVEDEAGTLVITEINYHAADDFDTDDWFEVYALCGDVDIGGWIIKDDRDDHHFQLPGEMVLLEGAYAVVATDTTAFRALFPTVPHLFGDMKFNLSNGGDQVRIYDAEGVLVDSVAYDDEPPWPVEPDGHGPTLQLLDPSYPNEHVHNWRASLMPHGDPGSGYATGMTLRILREDENHLLNWSPWPDACEYWIYGACNHVFFEPQLEFPFHHFLAAVPPNVTTWQVGPGIGDPTLNWAYLVLAVSDVHQELARSNRVGEFEREIDMFQSPDTPK